MSRLPSRRSRSPLLLGLLGLGGAGLAVLAGSGTRAGVAAVDPADPPGVAPAAELVLAPRSEARAPVRASVASVRDAEPDRSASGRDAPARKEREFRQAFLTLARGEPGALEARAQAVLEATGPAPEKVALLRALADTGSEECTRWHEHAARTSPDDSGPHAVSVAHYALGALARRAAREPDARQALLRLAFEHPDPPVELRRRAASAVARTGDAGELELLRRALLRETDELLLLGALAVLAQRTDLPQARRILDSFPVTAARAAPAAEE